MCTNENIKHASHNKDTHVKDDKVTALSLPQKNNDSRIKRINE